MLSAIWRVFESGNEWQEWRPRVGEMYIGQKGCADILGMAWRGDRTGGGGNGWGKDVSEGCGCGWEWGSYGLG